MKNKKTLIGIVLVLIVLLVLFGRGENVDLTQKYRQEPLTIGKVVKTVSANGTLNPVTLISVGTQVSGTVQKLHVDFNDRVKKGQVLMELDGELLQATERQSAANVLSAQASLELAQANFKRMQELFKKEYVSRQELDQARQSLKSAQASLQQAEAQNLRDRTNVGFTKILSPVDGVVIDRDVDEGQTVAASFQTPTLIKIAEDLKKMAIDTSFAEADIGDIKKGMPVHFTVDAFPNKKFQAVVEEVRLNPTTESNVVTYNVRVSVDNPDEILLPGMTAYVNIPVITHENVLLAPNSALRFKPPTMAKSASNGGFIIGGMGHPPPPPDRNKNKKNNESTVENNDGEQHGTVYVIRENEMVAVKVILGITDNKMTQIKSDNLKEGDLVVVGENLNNTGKKSGLTVSVF